MLLSHGCTYGRLVVDPETQLLQMEMGKSKEGKRPPYFEVVCSDIPSIKKLLSGTDEDLRLHYEFVDKQSVRILQAERKPEESTGSVSLWFYVSQTSYLKQGVLHDVGLVTESFLEKEIWQWMDTPEFELGDIEPAEYPCHWEVSIKLPPLWAMVFRHAPEKLKGHVFRPVASRMGCGGGTHFEFLEGTELVGEPLREALQRHKAEQPQLPAPKTTSRRVPPALRKKVLLRDGHRCVDCGANPATDPFVTLEVDHRISIANGGDNSIDNLQTLCWACNRGKGAANDHKLDADPWAA